VVTHVAPLLDRQSGVNASGTRLPRAETARHRSVNSGQCRGPRRTATATGASRTARGEGLLGRGQLDEQAVVRDDPQEAAHGGLADPDRLVGAEH
jgi:hypothetical protein